MYASDIIIPSAAYTLSGIALATVAHTGDPSLIEDAANRFYVVLGAVAGGVISVIAFPGKSSIDNLIRWGVAFIVGIFTTPALFVWRTWPTQPELLMFGSFIVATLSWMFINFIKGKKLEDLIKIWRTGSPEPTQEGENEGE